MPSAGRRTPPKGKAPPTATAGFWRITSSSKRNIELAVAAKQWGMRKASGVRAMAPGHRMVFYVSYGRHSGYWGTARITSKLFVSRTAIWPDDLYPVRFSLAPEGNLRSTPVTRAAVMSRLRRRRLKFHRQVAIIPLSADEYRTIAGLLKSTPERPPQPDTQKE